MRNVRHILGLMKSKRALILAQVQNGAGQTGIERKVSGPKRTARKPSGRDAIVLARQYILIPFGDRRRRPVGWLSRSDIETLLAEKLIEGGPDRFYLRLGTVLSG